MKKFKVEIIQNTYRIGRYELEAPDRDGASSVAEDIPFEDSRIVWEEVPAGHGYPKIMNIFVEEADEAHS